jgi:hypothetical protein
LQSSAAEGLEAGEVDKPASGDYGTLVQPLSTLQVVAPEIELHGELMV